MAGTAEARAAVTAAQPARPMVATRARGTVQAAGTPATLAPAATALPTRVRVVASAVRAARARRAETAETAAHRQAERRRPVTAVPVALEGPGATAAQAEAEVQAGTPARTARPVERRAAAPAVRQPTNTAPRLSAMATTRPPSTTPRPSHASSTPHR